LPSYELTYVLRPLDETALGAVNERVTGLISSSGGEITSRNDWGKRRLSYPIRKINEGYYVSLQLNLPTQAVRTVERALQLNDDVMRYLVIRVDEHEIVRPESERS
jgi:small subunit ribosomal protein S6